MHIGHNYFVENDVFYDLVRQSGVNLVDNLENKALFIIAQKVKGYVESKNRMLKKETIFVPIEEHIIPGNLMCDYLNRIFRLRFYSDTQNRKNVDKFICRWILDFIT